MTEISAAPLTQEPADDFRPITGPDAVVLAVHDARKAAHYYSATLAMRCTAYSGPANGNPETCAYVFETGPARYVLTSVVQVLTDHGRLIADHLARYGEGIVDLSLRVPDAFAAYDYAVDRGAAPIAEPYELTDRHGTVVLAVIATAGSARHTLVDRTRYAGPYLPGFTPVPAGVRPPTTSLYR
ncbi:VOC family protein [Kitasatospora sp. NPDC049258]|uniref:VOC family protein n=1 Tax=Kitasatospora sp. NPDC049258 TaxID=3155394 RepID=UPI003428399A